MERPLEPEESWDLAESPRTAIAAALVLLDRIARALENIASR